MAKAKTKIKTLKGFAATQALARWFDSRWPGTNGCGTACAARPLIHSGIQKKLSIDKLWQIAEKDPYADYFLERLGGLEEREQAENDIYCLDEAIGNLEGMSSGSHWSEARRLIKAAKALRAKAQKQADRVPKLVGIRKTRHGVIGVWQ